MKGKEPQMQFNSWTGNPVLPYDQIVVDLRGSNQHEILRKTDKKK